MIKHTSTKNSLFSYKNLLVCAATFVAAALLLISIKI